LLKRRSTRRDGREKEQSGRLRRRKRQDRVVHRVGGASGLGKLYPPLGGGGKVSGAGTGNVGIIPTPWLVVGGLISPPGVGGFCGSASEIWAPAGVPPAMLASRKPYSVRRKGRFRDALAAGNLRKVR